MLIERYWPGEWEAIEREKKRRAKVKRKAIKKNGEPAFKGELGFLSTMHFVTIRYGGITYPSVEHAFTAQKMLDQDWRCEIAGTMSPVEVKRMGDTVPVRADWEKVKVDIMRELLKRKFENSDLRAKLLATGDRHLEHTNWWGDFFWGVCKGKGENQLGKLLMEIRAALL